MKKLLLFLTASVCFCACKNEKLAIAGSEWDDIAIINKKNGFIEWRHRLNPGEECNSIQVTPEGHILYAYSKGAKMINRKHETLWEYQAGEEEEIHAVSQLPYGGFLVGVCGEPARIVEFDRKGKQIKEISFPTLIFHTHYQFRQVTKTKTDVYLIPLMEKQTVLVLSSIDRSMKIVYIGYDVFSAKQLANKKVIVSCGRDSRFVEVDPEDPHRLNRTVTSEIRGGILRYVAEILFYENGNKLIANSHLYNDDKTQPLLIEIDNDDNVVWTLPHNKEIKNITAIYSFFE